MILAALEVGRGARGCCCTVCGSEGNAPPGGNARGPIRPRGPPSPRCGGSPRGGARLGAPRANPGGGPRGGARVDICRETLRNGATCCFRGHLCLRVMQRQSPFTARCSLASALLLLRPPSHTPLIVSTDTERLFGVRGASIRAAAVYDPVRSRLLSQIWVFSVLQWIE